VLSEDRLLAATRVFIAEQLGSPHEKIQRCRLKEVPGISVSSPNVMILISPDRQADSTEADTVRLGIPDRLFSHRRGLITKDEVRIFTLAKLNLPREGIFWDIGSGSGSVAVEAALLAPELTIFAIEKNARRIRDIRSNKEKFGVGAAVTPLFGEAPRVLTGLPRPHRIFIGGSEGQLLPVLRTCRRALFPAGKIVVNAATLETVNSAMTFFEKFAWAAEVTLLTISKMKKVGTQKRFQALNPVFVIEAEKPGERRKTL
jgi:precorrin-6Y C5,15-methyltransferase (decarboxylating)